jgi:hypothetical protein
MRLVVFILLFNFSATWLAAKNDRDSSYRMALGADVSMYDGYIFSHIKNYRFGLDLNYKVTNKFATHLALFYNRIDGHDYTKRNTFNQLSYTFKIGPEYVLPLWKAKYHPSLVVNANISLVNIRTDADYRLENQYYTGQISEVYSNPLKSYLFYDFGLGIQAEYKRVKLKVQGFATPISTWRKFNNEQVDAKRVNLTNNYIPGYGFQSTTLYGNIFLYYNFLK